MSNKFIKSTELSKSKSNIAFYIDYYIFDTLDSIFGDEGIFGGYYPLLFQLFFFETVLESFSSELKLLQILI